MTDEEPELGSSDEAFEPSKASKAPMSKVMVRQLITSWRSRRKDEAKLWAKWVAWSRGRHEAEELAVRQNLSSDSSVESDDYDELRVDNNYVYAYMDTMTANVVPSNPQVTINPVKEEDAPYAKAQQTLANHLLRERRTKKTLKRMNQWACIVGFGIAKVCWDDENKTTKQTVVNPFHFYFDDSVPFEESRYYIEELMLSKEDVKSRIDEGLYDKKIAGALKYDRKYRGFKPSKSKELADPEMEFTAVYEVHDRPAQRISHVTVDGEVLLSGSNPYKTIPRWFVPLIHNDDVELWAGVSDIQLISDILDRINEIDTLELEHAHASVPRAVMNDAAFGDAEEAADALTARADPGSVIRVVLNNSHKNISDAIQFAPVAGMPPSFEIMRQRLVALLEMVLGIPAYMRGSVGNTDVATELALVDTANRTRNGRRVDANNDCVEELAKTHVLLHIENMGNAQVRARVDKMSPGELITATQLPTAEAAKDFIFDVVAESPTENHRMIQLEKLREFIPLFMESPAVSKPKLIKKLLSLLGLDELYDEKGAAAPPTALPGEPMPDGSNPDTGPDTLETGAVPGGMDEILLPPNTRAQADGPIALPEV